MTGTRRGLSRYCVAAVEDFEMGGALIEAREHGPRRGGDVADGIILADERLDRVEAVEPHQGLELDLVAEVAPHQVDMAKAGNAPAPRCRGSPRRERSAHRHRHCPASSTRATPADHCGRSSHPHRHQDVERVRLVVLAQQGRRGGVGQVDFDAVALDLVEDVHQIAGVEADLDPVGAIVGRRVPRSRGRFPGWSPTASPCRGRRSS